VWYATGKIILKSMINWFTFINFTRLVNTVALEFIMKNPAMLCRVAVTIFPEVLKDHSALVLWNVKQALSTQWYSKTSQLFRNSTVRKSNPITNIINIIIISFQFNPNIYSQYFYLLLKIKTNLCLTHKYIKSIQGKLLICTYLQQTLEYTKKVFISQELRCTVIYQ
jgi:hypothetical protein